MLNRLQWLRISGYAVLLCSFSSLADSFSVVLVRHAEKLSQLDNSGNADKNPPLSACGEARVMALATQLRDQPLTHIYSTDYRRTRQTAAPLAEQRGIAVQLYQPAQLAQFAKLLRQSAQHTLVVGHSNTTPQLATLLSGQPQADLTEQDYGVIYHIDFHADPAKAPTITVQKQPFSCADTAALATPGQGE